MTPDIERIAREAETDAVMAERCALIRKKHGPGLDVGEAAMLEWLNGEARRLCPRVTPEMLAFADEVRAKLAEVSERHAGIRARFGLAA